MALIVETGTSSATAESYASVAQADAYHTAHGNAAWAAVALEADKEIALRKATQYIDTRNSHRWIGKRSNAAQALDWPRSGVQDYDENWLASSEMPQALLDATMILALAALTEDLYPSVDANEGAVTVDKIVVGPIEILQEFGAGGAGAVKEYRLADGLLQQYTYSGGRLERG